MLVLAATTDKLVASITGTAPNATAMATYRDITATTYLPGRILTTLSVASTNYDVATAPAASTQRVIDGLTITNTNALTGAGRAIVVTLSYSDAGTLYTLNTVTLGPGERLEYADGVGMQVYSAGGSLKTAVGQVSVPSVVGTSRTAIASNVANSTVTISDCTGLSFAVSASTKYWFRAVVFYSSAATSTGSRWSIQGPASPTALAFRVESTLTATTQANYEGLVAYDTPATASASSLTAGNIAIIEGRIQPSAAGTVIVRFASEIGGSAITALAGSFLDYGSY